MASVTLSIEPPEVAEHFGWPLWKVESALAYAESFKEEISRQVAEHNELDDEAALRKILPSLHVSEALKAGDAQASAR